MEDILFFDLEIGLKDYKVYDIGAVCTDGREFHQSSLSAFAGFASGSRFLCGHNILQHDLKAAGEDLMLACPQAHMIDTLPLSPLLFPVRPYHRLLKDDKLQTEEMNNPVNDARKARQLFEDEVEAFVKLPLNVQRIFCALLAPFREFKGFFAWMGCAPEGDAAELIRQEFEGRICSNADLETLCRRVPVELAYTLALIRVDDRYSITPPWVMHTYPLMDNVMKLLRGTPCSQGCSYCSSRLDVRQRLRDIFGFESFRTYEGEPLQENAARAAVEGASLLAVFPTGGGKSVTFQLPAMIAGEMSRGLTVVISPLQSLMKDQVDNLEKRGIVDAVTINGQMDPIARKNAMDRVANGLASILYISPESLRSRTIEYLLSFRNVVRFVIDEAHCFSAWGQDFRVDYMYIGDFIRKLQEAKGLNHSIPVSCFTATAKQKVISDIRQYFKEKLGLDLQLFTTAAARKNLRYAVIYKASDEEKYTELRTLIQDHDCPSIVYVSRTKTSERIAARLREDGIEARHYHGQMDPPLKVENQNDFISGLVQVIVATSAFGMGVDKKDVGLVVHYEISDSLENYVQEAGRAGRDEHIQADCYVLFNENDLDRHFVMLNQTRLSIGEIQQVWRAVKEMSRLRSSFSASALEIARAAGWDDTKIEIETRVRTSLAALEDAGYLERGRNVPHIYADSLLVRNVMEGNEILIKSKLFSPEQLTQAGRILKYLISRRYTLRGSLEEPAESRVDYLADRLGITRAEAVDTILLMREAGVLADNMDLTAYIRKTGGQKSSDNLLRLFLSLEEFLTRRLDLEEEINYKQLNEEAEEEGIRQTSVRNIRTLVMYWMISGVLKKGFHPDEEHVRLERTMPVDVQRKRLERRGNVARFVVSFLQNRSEGAQAGPREELTVRFSVNELQTAYNMGPNSLLEDGIPARVEEIKEALLYLSKIGAMTIEGGFMVAYNAMQIRRKVMDNRIKYKQDDYAKLNEYYRQRMQQIHIVGEYARMMVKSYEDALQFVSDYFQMEYRAFITKYFKGNRRGEINRNITPGKYEKLFGGLSRIQKEIIDDDQSRVIVVAAGPGSGKTRTLVHKLASLLIMEDIKQDQLLMLTFSRAAATEFHQRLNALIGKSASFVEIKTFHSYCFDLLGRIGTLEESENVVSVATQKIRNGEVEQGRITKTVLVIDEAQDMSAQEYDLVRALMERNDDMRVIAVGDDDQNIFEFRGSDSAHLRSLRTDYSGTFYEMVDNYRSDRSIVEVANWFAGTITDRMKHQDIQAVSQRPGRVVMRCHSSGNLTIPVAAMLDANGVRGSCCILTATNEEALKMTGLLKQRGRPVRLIQSNEGFDLFNLAEMRYFVRCLGDEKMVSKITEENWEAARSRLAQVYSRSSCLEQCLRLLDVFRETNSRLYRTDLLEFLHESRLEDYQQTPEKTVLVSTIHKAKGHEFDTVYLILGKKYDLSTDAARRAVYVAMTRARSALFIYSSNAVFNRLEPPACVERKIENLVFPPPGEILLQLTHRDVALGYFAKWKTNILKLRSGDPLKVDGEYLLDPGCDKPICRFSQAFSSRLQGLREKHYEPVSAAVRFVVAWRGEKDPDESAVLLPDLRLKLQEGQHPNK